MKMSLIDGELWMQSIALLEMRLFMILKPLIIGMNITCQSLGNPIKKYIKCLGGWKIGFHFFRKVFCSTCGTQVGAIDEEEVYHFFGVLPSPPYVGKKWPLTTSGYSAWISFEWLSIAHNSWYSWYSWYSCPSHIWKRAIQTLSLCVSSISTIVWSQHCYIYMMMPSLIGASISGHTFSPLFTFSDVSIILLVVVSPKLCIRSLVYLNSILILWK